MSFPRWRPPVLAFCLLALLAALAPPSAEAAGAAAGHELTFTFTGGVEITELGARYVPPPEGQFEDACGVAVDGAGEILISDYYHRLLDLFSPGRAYLAQTAVLGPDGPCNLAFDPDGVLYVNDWRRDVVRYRPDGAGGYEEAGVIDSARSTGVAVDAAGRIYVDDRTYVAVYEPSGEPVHSAGLPLRIGLGSLGSGYGIAVSEFPGTEGDLYVLDAAAGLVRVYGPDGEELAPILGLGTPERGFVSLQDADVAVDPADGHVFVAQNLEPGFEHPAAAVDEFNPAGEYRGRLPGRIIDAEPSALAVAEGQVYVTSGNDEGAALLGFGPTLPARRLTVALAGSGHGRVTSEPAGINCAGACAAEFDEGEEVLLTAVPEPGSAFVGWSGAGCSGTALCATTMSVDREVTAEFAPAPAAPSTAPGPDAEADGAEHRGGPPAGTAAGGAGAALLRAWVISSAGAVRLAVATAEAGTLSVRGPDLRPLKRQVGPGRQILRLRPTRAAAALAVTGGRALRATATVTFRAAGGRSERIRRKVAFAARSAAR
ncbi:MAG TPA: hypothetical protein VMF55_13840 [Solirubrobacterales bacterium]|nr:hypothetical protein [Solirubrobacterales bacterium]